MNIATFFLAFINICKTYLMCAAFTDSTRKFRGIYYLVFREFWQCLRIFNIIRNNIPHPGLKYRNYAAFTNSTRKFRGIHYLVFREFLQCLRIFNITGNNIPHPELKYRNNSVKP